MNLVQSHDSTREKFTHEVFELRLSMLDRAMKAVDDAVNFMKNKVEVVARNIFPAAFVQERQYTKQEIVAAMTADAMAGLTQELGDSSISYLNATDHSDITPEMRQKTKPSFKVLGRFILGLLKSNSELQARIALDLAYARL